MRQHHKKYLGFFKGSASQKMEWNVGGGGVIYVHSICRNGENTSFLDFFISFNQKKQFVHRFGNSLHFKLVLICSNNAFV